MSYYENRRLYAIKEFFRLLTICSPGIKKSTDALPKFDPCARFPEISDEVTSNCLHVVTGFSVQQIPNGDREGLIVYDAPTGKHIEISFKYIENGGEHER